MTTTDLGTGWSVAPAPEGGVSLRVSSSRRGIVVGGAAMLALAWIGRTVQTFAMRQPSPLGTSFPTAIGIGVVLGGFALWCALGSESWRVAPNCLEHRVGVAGWRHVRRFSDASLEIVGDTDRLGRPFHRLYAVVGGEQHFILERRLPELNAWADLAAAQTGWSRRDAWRS